MSIYNSRMYCILNTAPRAKIAPILRLATYATHHGTTPAKIFQVRTPKDQALRLFKNQLWLIANDKDYGKVNSQLHDAIDALAQGRFPAGLGVQRMARELYTLSLQQRITPDDIYKAIVYARGKANIVNVKMPANVATRSRAATSGGENHIPGDIHPQADSEFNNVLQQILELKDSNSNELYQVLSNLIEESSESQKFVSEAVGEKSDVKQINIRTLEEYLKLIGKRQQQKDFVIKEQKKVYDWNRALESTPHHEIDAVAGSIRHGSAADASLSRVFKELFKSFGGKRSNGITQYMLLNVKTNAKSHKDPSDISHALMYLEDMDIINIANRTTINQNDIRIQLNKLKTENWEPLGTLSDSPEVIVLEKKIEKSSSFSKWYLGILVTIGIIVPLKYYNRKPSPERSTTTEESTS